MAQVWIGLEWLGAVLGVLAVWALSHRKRWGFYASLGASTLLVMVLYRSRLYGDMLANLYFLAMSIDGILRWQADESLQKIQKLSAKQWLVILLVTLLIWLGWFWIFAEIQTKFKVMSAGVVALSAVGQWLLNRRFLENWWVWIACNSLTICMSALSGLWAVAVLYGIYLGIAVKGAWRWHQESKHL